MQPKDFKPEWGTLTGAEKKIYAGMDYVPHKAIRFQLPILYAVLSQLYNNKYTEGIEGVKALPKKDVLEYFSNHIGLTDYLRHELEFYANNLRMPIIGAGTNLSDKLEASKKLSDKYVKYVMENFSYKFFRDRTKENLNATKAFLTDRAFRNEHWLDYPGSDLVSACSKNGRLSEFKRLFFEAAIASQQKMNQVGEGRQTIIVPAPLVYEVIADFGFYGDMKNLRKDADSGRYEEIIKQALRKTKGDQFAVFSVPIGVDNFMLMNEGLNERALSENLRKYTWNRFMDDVPLMSTAIAAMAFSKMNFDKPNMFSDGKPIELLDKAATIKWDNPDEREKALKELYSALHGSAKHASTEGLVEEAEQILADVKKYNVPMAANIRGKDAGEIIDRAIGLFESAYKKPLLDANGLIWLGNMEDGSAYALLMYANMGRQILEHHKHKMEGKAGLK